MDEEELRKLTEEYLGIELPQIVWEAAKGNALQKLIWILSREGDAGGERLKPYYLAQLIAEDVRAQLLSVWCDMKNEDKKRAASKADNPNKRPHYSIDTLKSQETHEKMLWRS